MSARTWLRRAFPGVLGVGRTPKAKKVRKVVMVKDGKRRNKLGQNFDVLEDDFKSFIMDELCIWEQITLIDLEHAEDNVVDGKLTWLQVSEMEQELQAVKELKRTVEEWYARKMKQLYE
jgi:hypothetical protein